MDGPQTPSPPTNLRMAGGSLRWHKHWVVLVRWGKIISHKLPRIISSVHGPTNLSLKHITTPTFESLLITQLQWQSMNHMGASHSDPCNRLGKQISEWCIDRNISLSAAHNPGVHNIKADFESRRTNDNTEWMLDRTSLNKAMTQLSLPRI